MHFLTLNVVIMMASHKLLVASSHLSHFCCTFSVQYNYLFIGLPLQFARICEKSNLLEVSFHNKIVGLEIMQLAVILKVNYVVNV
jgi:hypothetical protein